jgi:hypothetical protein
VPVGAQAYQGFIPRIATGVGIFVPVGTHTYQGLVMGRTGPHNAYMVAAEVGVRGRIAGTLDLR